MTDIENSSFEDLEPKGVEQPKSQLPTYHWSEISSPRYKGCHSGLLCGDSITITQTVHKKNVTPKTTKASPALVVYDKAFLGYKMLESIAQLVSEYLDNETDGTTPNISIASTRAIFDNQLLELFTLTVSNAINVHKKAVDDCSELGVELDYDSSTILRSVKSWLARKYNAS